MSTTVFLTLRDGEFLTSVDRESWTRLDRANSWTDAFLRARLTFSARLVVVVCIEPGDRDDRAA